MSCTALFCQPWQAEYVSSAWTSVAVIAARSAQAQREQRYHPP